MSFNLALGVLKGWSDIPDYTAPRTQDAGLRTVMGKVRHVPDPADGSVNVTIVTTDGKRIAKNIKHAPGDPTFGLQEQRTLDKFRACAAYRLSPEAVASIEKGILALDTLPSMTDLMAALTQVATGPRVSVPA
jgi:2-methylcitrate dehydratase PrpD